MNTTKPDPLIVAFLGRAGSGKDTSSKFIEEYLNQTSGKCVHMFFAEPLKRYCNDLFGTSFGIPREHFFGSQDQKNADLAEYGLPGQSGRSILQLVGGDEGMRRFHDEVWARYLMNRARGVGADVIIISDARYQSECDVVKAYGGIIVKLTRNMPQYTGFTKWAIDLLKRRDGTDPNAGVSGHIVKWLKMRASSNQGVSGHASELEMDSVKESYCIDNANMDLAQTREAVRGLIKTQLLIQSIEHADNAVA